MQQAIAVTVKGINDNLITSQTQRLVVSRIKKIRAEDNTAMTASNARIEYINEKGEIDVYSVSQTADAVGILIEATDSAQVDSTTPDTRTGAGAVSLTTTKTMLVSSGVAQAITLAAGVEGQIKKLVHKTDGGSMVLTPTPAGSGYTTITFTNVGETATLQYIDGGWRIIGLFGAVAA